MAALLGWAILIAIVSFILGASITHPPWRRPGR